MLQEGPLKQIEQDNNKRLRLLALLRQKAKLMEVQGHFKLRMQKNILPSNTLS